MLSKNEYFHMKMKLQKKELALSEFELKSPLYTQFLELRSAGHDEYVRRTKIWNKYYQDVYQDVQSSPIGLLLKEMSEITKKELGKKMSKETRERIREIVSKSEESKDETNKILARPTFEDPLYVSYKISGYIRLLAEIKETKLLLSEYKEIYEKPKDSPNMGL